jgi:hypothetical protein
LPQFSGSKNKPNGTNHREGGTTIAGVLLAYKILVGNSERKRVHGDIGFGYNIRFNNRKGPEEVLGC